MLHVENAARSLASQVFWLGCGLVLLIGAAFAVSLAACIMAQTTQTASGSLVAKGSKNSGIISTAAAENNVPVALAALLTPNQLGRVKEIMLSNLGTVEQDGSKAIPCEDCPKTLIMQVDVAMQYRHHQPLCQPSDLLLLC